MWKIIMTKHNISRQTQRKRAIRHWVVTMPESPEPICKSAKHADRYSLSGCSPGRRKEAYHVGVVRADFQIVNSRTDNEVILSQNRFPQGVSQFEASGSILGPNALF